MPTSSWSSVGVGLTGFTLALLSGMLAPGQAQAATVGGTVSYTYDPADNRTGQTGIQSTYTVYDGTGGTPAAVTFHGVRAQYAISFSNLGVTVVDSVAGRDGTSVLVNVPVMIFSDQSAVDVDSAGATVARLFQAVFGRRPDAGGLVGWTAYYKGGASPATIAQSFLTSAEYTGAHPNLTDSQFLTLLYQNALGRAPDSGGFSGWLAQLAAGMSRGQVAALFASGAECITYTAGWIYTVSGAVNV